MDLIYWNWPIKISKGQYLIAKSEYLKYNKGSDMWNKFEDIIYPFFFLILINIYR